MSDVAREIMKKNLRKKKGKTQDGGVSFLIQQAKKAVKGPKNAEYDKYAYDL